MGDDEKMRGENKVEKETKFEATGGIETSEINKLTDDCLIEIFQYLTTIAEKIRIERVCKRWQNVSRKSWNNFKSLDFLAKTWGINANGSIDQRSIKSIDFEKVVRLSGSYLTRISTDLVTFGKICHLLPQIRELNLWDLSGNHYYPRSTVKTSCKVILTWLISYGKNITLFQMKVTESRHYQEKVFARFLGEMKQLKSFCLDVDFSLIGYWTGTCLLELPFETIQEIILKSNLEYFDQNILSTMLKNCKKLRTFSIEGCIGPANGILKALSLQADTLKNLQIQFDDLDNRTLLLSTMSALVHLEKLCVGLNYYVTDAFLKVVGKHCTKLTYLNLFQCDEVTDEGISSICNLEKLTYLSIVDLPQIRNPPLEKLTSLVVLDSRRNEGIQKECICSFLRKAHQLRALGFDESSIITNDLLNAATEATRMHYSNNQLDLYVYFTEESIEYVFEIPPFVNIIPSDYLPIAKYVEYPFFHFDPPEVYITRSKIT